MLMSEQKIRYGALGKAAAFCRGLPRLEPMIEVSVTALRKGYALDKEEERRHVMKVSKLGTNRICSILSEGCAERGQLALVAILAARLAPASPGRPQKARKDDEAPAEAKELTPEEARRIRSMDRKAKSVLEGRKMSSAEAQRAIAAAFAYGQDVDGFYLNMAHMANPESGSSTDYRDLAARTLRNGLYTYRDIVQMSRIAVESDVDPELGRALRDSLVVVGHMTSMSGLDLREIMLPHSVQR